MKKAAEILARVLDDKNRKLGQAYSSIFGAWSQIVGESLAEHSRIYEIANRNLFIEVDHPGWMQLLLMKKSQILRALKRKYPEMEVKELRVKVNLSYAAPTSEEVQPGVDHNEGEVKTTGEQLKELERILSSVREEQLRRRLRRLFLKSLEKEDSDRG